MMRQTARKFTTRSRILITHQDGGGAATSLWINVHTKLKATDLQSNGDFIQITQAFITLNNVTSTPACKTTQVFLTVLL
jgi:hypothetical protein